MRSRAYASRHVRLRVDSVKHCAPLTADDRCVAVRLLRSGECMWSCSAALERSVGTNNERAFAVRVCVYAQVFCVRDSGVRALPAYQQHICMRVSAIATYSCAVCPKRNFPSTKCARSAVAADLRELSFSAAAAAAVLCAAERDRTIGQCICVRHATSDRARGNRGAGSTRGSDE